MEHLQWATYIVLFLQFSVENRLFNSRKFSLIKYQSSMQLTANYFSSKGCLTENIINNVDFEKNL
jgi:hypothetical protein